MKQNKYLVFLKCRPILMDLINLLLNLKIYAKIQTKLFFLEFFVFKKNAKSCHVFFLMQYDFYLRNLAICN